MKLPLLLTVYCALIMAASLLGGWLPRLLRMTHLRTQLLISFVAGLMLSIATYQLLPHSITMLGSPELTGSAVLAGVVIMFLMLRAFHVHAHAGSPLRVDAEDQPQETDAPPGEATTPTQTDHASHSHHCGSDEHTHEPAPTSKHTHHHSHPHGADCDHDHAPQTRHHAPTWVGMLIGLGVHSLMDGVALAASVAADASQGAWMGLLGLGTFLAIALHKPLDAFAITSTMDSSGASEETRGMINLTYALLSPTGVTLFWIGGTRLGMTEWLIGLGLAVSAGFFICIALADLLPEVHFHSHDRVKLTAVFLLGVALAIAVENLPGHNHEHHGGESHSERVGEPQPATGISNGAKLAAPIENMNPIDNAEPPSGSQ